MWSNSDVVQYLILINILHILDNCEHTIKHHMFSSGYQTFWKEYLQIKTSFKELDTSNWNLKKAGGYSVLIPI